MKVRWSPLFGLACLLTLALAMPVLAGNRDYWRHSKGHFENTSGNKWTEKIEKNVYYFVERDRTPAFIELFDRSRDCTVRLYDRHADVRFGKAKFERYYDGRWGR